MKKFVCAITLAGLMSGCSHFTVKQPKPSVSTEGYSADRDDRYEQSVRDLREKGYSSSAADRVASKQNPAGETVYSDSLLNVLTGKSGR